MGACFSSANGKKLQPIQLPENPLDKDSQQRNSLYLACTETGRSDNVVVIAWILSQYTIKPEDFLGTDGEHVIHALIKSDLPFDDKETIFRLLIGENLDVGVYSGDPNSEEDLVPVVSRPENSVDRNLADKNGETAIIHTARQGDIKLMYFLTDLDVNCSVKTADGDNLLMLLAKTNATGLGGIARILVDRHQLNPHDKNNKDYTAMMFAAMQAHYNLLYYLLTLDNNGINEKNSQGDTALHCLIRHFPQDANEQKAAEFQQCLQLLLDFDADRTATNNHLQTPETLALERLTEHASNTKFCQQLQTLQGVLSTEPDASPKQKIHRLATAKKQVQKQEKEEEDIGYLNVHGGDGAAGTPVSRHGSKGSVKRPKRYGVGGHQSAFITNIGSGGTAAAADDHNAQRVIGFAYLPTTKT